MKSRRQFIQSCSSALLGATVMPVIGAVRPARGISFTAFAGQLHSEFSLSQNGGTVAVTLAEAAPHFPKNKPELADHRNFKIRFTSVEKQELREIEQGSYAFQHPALGEFELFVVPNTATEGRVNYLAFFHGAPIKA